MKICLRSLVWLALVALVSAGSVQVGQPLGPVREAQLRKQIRDNFFVPDPLPPLDAKTYRTFSPAPGVKAEGVAYTTQLGARVSAILYLPDPLPKEKIPAFVVVNGHGGDKYSWYSFYTGILFARAGVAVLTYDQAGEGERNADHKSGTREHDQIKGGSNMARHLAGLMITDVMQAVSYLRQRSEVDSKQIAVGGYSLGSFVVALTGAIDTRIHACVLCGGGNLDGPGGYWDKSNKSMCQALPYQSLDFLGDRPAVIYALHATRGPTMIFNGLGDTVVGIPSHSETFFKNMLARAAQLHGSLTNVFEFGFAPTNSGHRPYWLTKPVAMWLEKQIDFPNWTAEQIQAMPEIKISDWAETNRIFIDKLYATDLREGGTPALDDSVPGYTRDELNAMPQAEWEPVKRDFILETWVDAAQKDATNHDDSLVPAAMRYKFVTVDDNIWCDPRREDEVAKEVDRIVADGFNGISIGTYDFMPMYFVDYSKTKYPEAQEFDEARVKQNVATLRHNIRLAKSKGIRFFVSRSYCHYAPYNFWKVHQSELNPGGIFTPLLKNAHQSDIYLNTLAGKGRIIPQQQWSNPVFRNFFLDSTAAMLDAIPELDGFLNAYAEAAWHYDLKKLKTSDGKNWKALVDYAATDNEFVDYCNSLFHMLKEKRGDQFFFGMRDWYVKPEMMSRLDIPAKELVISVKYAGYDQPLVNYPPWGKTLLDQGYSVILDMLVFDAEHPHPIYWYDPEMISGIYSNIYAGGFSGVMYQDFVTKGGDSPNNPIRLLTEKTVGAAVKQEPFTHEEAVAFLKPYYGSGAEDLLVSLKKVSVAQAELIKLCPAWFWQGDGLTPGGPQTLRFWMLMDNPDAPPGMAFVRQNVVSIKEYVAALLSGKAGLEQSLTSWKKEHKETPVEVMNLMQTCADDAITAARLAREKAPANAPYIQDIVASAVIHKQMVLRDCAFLNAAIAFYESGGQYDDKYNLSKEMLPTGVDERDECVRQFQILIGHDEILRKLCSDYAPRRRETRSKNDYAFERKIAEMMGKKLDVPAMNEQELKAMTALILNFPNSLSPAAALTK